MADIETKKATKPKVAKTAPAHPKYSEMVSSAITSLKERTGSSRQAILKYIIETYKLDEKVAAVHIKPALKRGVEKGLLKQVKGTGANGSFRVVPVKPAPKKPKKVADKKTVKKDTKKTVKKTTKKTALVGAKKAKKTTAKKPAAKKTPAKKPAAKKTPAKKPATKKTPAKKPAAKKPATKKPAAKKPATKKTTSKK